MDRHEYMAFGDAHYLLPMCQTDEEVDQLTNDITPDATHWTDPERLAWKRAANATKRAIYLVELNAEGVGA